MPVQSPLPIFRFLTPVDATIILAYFAAIVFLGLAAPLYTQWYKRL